MGLLRVESHSRFPKDARSATPCLTVAVGDRNASLPFRPEVLQADVTQPMARSGAKVCQCLILDFPLAGRRETLSVWRVASVVGATQRRPSGREKWGDGPLLQGMIDRSSGAEACWLLHIQTQFRQTADSIALGHACSGDDILKG